MKVINVFLFTFSLLSVIYYKNYKYNIIKIVFLINDKSDYFYKWRIKPNPTKTEVYAFHLKNKQLYKEIEVVINSMQV
jgi:hypothetical protein